MLQGKTAIRFINHYGYHDHRSREKNTMGRIAYIKWEPFNSVHVEILDEQHRKLFDIVNDLIDEIEMGSDRLLPVINELVGFLAIHFRHEEIVMTESGYPDILKHVKEHQRFTDKAEEFFQEYKHGDFDLEYKWITYLKAWVYDHTTKMDREYGEYLLNYAEKLHQS